MKTDGVFDVHSFSIPVKLGTPFRIIFFGDIHRDSPNHARKAWQDDLAYFRTLKDAYYFGMGDYLDSTSTSERACLGRISDEMHETFAHDLNELQAAKVEMMAKEMAFMRGRIIGLLGGNHFWKFSHGGTSDTELAKALKCKYLGVSAFVRLNIDSCTPLCSLDIWAHHGAGGARLPGGSINRVDQMREHAEADIFAMGHDHKRGALPATPRLYLSRSSRDGIKVKSRQQWLVRSGSYLASYEPGVRNYNVDAARGPCSLGHVQILVTARRPQSTDEFGKESRAMELDIHSYT